MPPAEWCRCEPPARRVTGARSIELLVNPLLLQRQAQLPVLLDRHDDRNYLTTTVDHIMGVLRRQFTHGGNGNETV